jgi:DNA-directed RNA polymerase sigma subunit (sigma70/sigma32)
MSFLNRLDVRERLVLGLHYGLDGEPPLSLAEIGRRIVLTREWVRMIELRAVRRLAEFGKEREEGGPVHTRGR